MSDRDCHWRKVPDLDNKLMLWRSGCGKHSRKCNDEKDKYMGIGFCCPACFGLIVAPGEKLDEVEIVKLRQEFKLLSLERERDG